ncbi:MAG: SNF2-related protein [Trueperaceae bacterium]
MLNLDAILQEFTSSTLAKAHQLRREGKIRSYEHSGQRITGKVRGSAGETYKQTIEIHGESENISVHGECTCPVGYNCKHVAALLIQIFETSRSRDQRVEKVLKPWEEKMRLMKQLQEVKARKAEEQRIPPLPQELSLWLEQAKREPQEVNLYTSHRCLVYVLSLEYSSQKQRRVKLELFSAKLTKDNEFVDIKPYTATNTPPQYARAEADNLRMMAAASKTVYGYGQSGLHAYLENNEMTQTLLKRILSTERCFWQKVDVPLVLAAPRPATLEWRVTDSGAQESVLHATPEAQVTLPFTPPWYIETLTGEMGLLEPDVSPERVKLFLDCPPVAAESLEQFRSAFAKLDVLPAPKPLEIKREQPTLQPHLTLLSEPFKSWPGSAEIMVDSAALEFAYGDKVIPVTLKDETLNHYDNGVLRILSRDMKAERMASNTLHQFGFTPVKRLYYGFPETKSHHYTLLGDEAMQKQEWLEFVQSAVPKLGAQGWQIVFDPSFRYQVVLPESWYGNVQDGDEGWFGLELGVMVEGQQVSLIPLLVALLQTMAHKLSTAALAAMPDDEQILVPYGHRHLALTVSRVRPILSVLLELYLKDSLTNGVLHLPMLDAARLLELEEALNLRWLGADRLLELGKRLRNFEGIVQTKVPEGFQGTLRPYQEQGLAWLQFLREYNLNGILADDMGLGKTLQALAHVLAEKEAGRAEGPSLVVAPTSLMHNWQSEAKKFAPDLNVIVLHGKERKQHFKDIAKADLVLTTYPLIVRDALELEKHKYHLLILDEAQYVKNAKTNSFKTVASFKANHRLCLSGTPLENHLGELWSLFNFLMPGFLGNSDKFKRLYRTPIEKNGDDTRQRQLAKRVKPFILRRDKAMVAKELPEKSEFIVPIQLEDDQRDLYETLRVSMHERVREEITKKGLARSQIMILDALLKLRQSCCDPRLVSVKEAKKVKGSAKLEWLRDTLPGMLEDGRKVLIFSQFATLLGLLEDTLENLEISYAKITGQTKDRPTQIEKFQSGKVSVFLITLKAGGVGLNLTAADTVIHYDPWWNPAAENQATDRAHRIGQDKPVFVYKLITSGSIEEKILKLQERKAALAAGILSGSLGSTVSLSQDDVKELFEPLKE